MAPSALLSRIFFLFIALLGSAQALHFYLEPNQSQCFTEEVPTDTIVTGHYRALEWDGTASYKKNEELGIQVTEGATGHTVVKTRGPSEGQFTFTAHESGEHMICLGSNETSTWFGAKHIRLYLDIVVGSAKRDVEHDRSHVSVMSGKLRELNDRLGLIRREQQYQREREAVYRDLSEATNSRAVWYCVAQIVVLVTTCAWQLRYLKNFFEDRKVL
ncbi:hypothetical protein BOTBODRAFT_439706 [Botryobasidium botryosum FD-172 SS1]|uniref:GOLD domain-containing protein n=1 Tax=Botryobasidium botryosum (strain FD-172 SS1) TaxID=930990 RepID=A0A067MV31_BOTB1|nr:hypothetical protein BOTBODRAFT_439706 [Botryobasidium botryosum FD-172 SS1]